VCSVGRSNWVRWVPNQPALFKSRSRKYFPLKARQRSFRRYDLRTLEIRESKEAKDLV
jgi:hypothetical protein